MQIIQGLGPVPEKIVEIVEVEVEAVAMAEGAVEDTIIQDRVLAVPCDYSL